MKGIFLLSINKCSTSNAYGTRLTDGSLLFGTQKVTCCHQMPLWASIQKTLNDIHKLLYMYIVHVPFLVFIILWYHWCENLLHISIVLFDVSRAIFSTYFLYYVVMMLWYVLTLFGEKKALKYSSMNKSSVNFCCKYHLLVLSLSLFLTCDILLGYMEKQRKEKNIYKKENSRQTLPLFGAFCEALLMLWLGCAWERMHCISP